MEMAATEDDDDMSLIISDYCMPSLSDMSSDSTLTQSQYAKVIFHDLLAVYPTDADIWCRYSVTDGVKIRHGDRVALYRVGWSSVQDHVHFELAPVPLDAAAVASELHVLFKADSLPKDTNEFYQLCYVNADGSVCGASVPFQFRRVRDEELCEEEDSDGLLVVRSRTAINEDKLREATDRIEKLESELSSNESKNESELRDRVELESKLRAEREEELATVRDRENKLRSELEAKLATATENDSKLRAELEAKLATATENDSKLRAELEAKLATATENDSKLRSELEAKLATATEDLRLRILYAGKLESELEESKQVTKNLTAMVVSLTNEKASLTDMVAKNRGANDAELNFLKIQLDNMQQMLEAATQSKEMASQALHCEQAKVMTLNIEHDKYKFRASTLEGDLEKTRARASRELQEVENELRRVREQARVAQGAMEEELHRCIAEAHATQEQLRGDFERCKREESAKQIRLVARFEDVMRKGNIGWAGQSAQLEAEKANWEAEKARWAEEQDKWAEGADGERTIWECEKAKWTAERVKWEGERAKLEEKQKKLAAWEEEKAKWRVRYVEWTEDVAKWEGEKAKSDEENARYKVLAVTWAEDVAKWEGEKAEREDRAAREREKWEDRERDLLSQIEQLQDALTKANSGVRSILSASMRDRQEVAKLNAKIETLLVEREEMSSYLVRPGPEEIEPSSQTASVINSRSNPSQESDSLTADSGAGDVAEVNALNLSLMMTIMDLQNRKANLEIQLDEVKFTEELARHTRDEMNARLADIDREVAANEQQLVKLGVDKKADEQSLKTVNQMMENFQEEILRDDRAEGSSFNEVDDGRLQRMCARSHELQCRVMEATSYVHDASQNLLVLHEEQAELRAGLLSQARVESGAAEAKCTLLEQLIELDRAEMADREKLFAKKVVDMERAKMSRMREADRQAMQAPAEIQRNVPIVSEAQSERNAAPETLQRDVPINVKMPFGSSAAPGTFQRDVPDSLCSAGWEVVPEAAQAEVAQAVAPGDTTAELVELRTRLEMAAEEYRKIYVQKVKAEKRLEKLQRKQRSASKEGSMAPVPEGTVPSSSYTCPMCSTIFPLSATAVFLSHLEVHLYGKSQRNTTSIWSDIKTSPT